MSMRRRVATVRAARAKSVSVRRIPMERIFFVLGSLFALVGVAAGAFGAHALRGVVAAGSVRRVRDRRALPARARARAAGGRRGRRRAGRAARRPRRARCLSPASCSFSGSLYLLALTGARVLGAVAPFGGVAFIAGWACLAWSAWSARPEEPEPASVESMRVHSSTPRLRRPGLHSRSSAACCSPPRRSLSSWPTATASMRRH